MATQTNSVYRIDPAELPGEAVIFGSTAAMRAVRSRIDSVLSSEMPVLIQGESGTGKEVLARFLHSCSSRRDAPFVRLNCAVAPSNLLATELFGCEKGFIAGSPDGRHGLIEIAEGGTLFLDEIASMHWDMQGKLLELLQDGSHGPMGTDEKRKSRVRVICATNVDLQGLVSSGAFRQDLFSRINVVCLRLSALRDRKIDIPQLCEYLFQKLSRQFRRSVPQLKPDTLCLLKQWDWPGNLRELENWVARAILLGDEFAEGSEFSRQGAAGSTLNSRAPRLNILKRPPRRTTPAVTGAKILKVLRSKRWVRRKTAEKLKMSKHSLLYKLRKAGVPRRRRTHRGLPLDTSIREDAGQADWANRAH
jgi:DNA-binding NtrC family response regulator